MDRIAGVVICAKLLKEGAASCPCEDLDEAKHRKPRCFAILPGLVVENSTHLLTHVTKPVTIQTAN